jgi:hypothetical protein
MRWRPSAIQIEFVLLATLMIWWLASSAKYLLSYLAGI